MKPYHTKTQAAELPTGVKTPTNLHAKLAEETAKSLAGLVRQKRLAGGITLDELAERSGISAASICRLELNRRGLRLPVSNLIRLFNTMGTRFSAQVRLAEDCCGWPLPPFGVERATVGTDVEFACTQAKYTAAMIARSLREERLRQHVRLKDLAPKMDIELSTLARQETSNRELLVRPALTMCSALGLRFSYLVAKVENRHVPPEPGRRPSGVVERITTDVTGKIHEGVYPSGTRLPSIRALGVEYHASPSSVWRAMQTMTAAGLVTCADSQSAVVV